MTQELRVHLVTWNVADQGPPPPGRLELGKLIQHDSATPADVCAIGLQEVRKSSDWATLLAKEVSKSDYVLARSIQMQSILLFVYVLRKHLPFVTNVETQYTRTAFGGLLGHKGAVSFRADLYGVNIVIVNCHLCAFDEKFSERIENYNVIIAGQTFKDNYAENILDHDYVFWIGDLNFRIDDLGRDEIIERINRNDYSTILKNDQLLKARQEELIFLDFEEGAITFPPTYKFDIGSNIYDSGPKCRKPAWCDRILYMVHEDAFTELSALDMTNAEGHRVDPRLWVRPLVYTSIMDYLYSDHKPVINQCIIKVFNIVPAVVFDDPQGWQCSNDAVVRYRVIGMPTSTWDYIALFKADFFTLDEYVSYVYASAKRDSAAASASTISVCTAKFPASALKKPGLYRLCYISAGKKFIRGMSNAFEVQPKYVLAPLPPVAEEEAVATLEAFAVSKGQLTSASEGAAEPLGPSLCTASRSDAAEIFADASTFPAVQEFPARAWVPPDGTWPADLKPETVGESTADQPNSVADAADAGIASGGSGRIHPGMSIQELKVMSAELRQEQRRKQSTMSLLMAKASKLSARLPGVSLIFTQPRIVEEQSLADQSRLVDKQQQQPSASVLPTSPAKLHDEQAFAEQQHENAELRHELTAAADTAATTIPNDEALQRCSVQPCADQQSLPRLLQNNLPSSEKSCESPQRTQSHLELHPLQAVPCNSLPPTVTPPSSEHSVPLHHQPFQPLTPAGSSQSPISNSLSAAREPLPSPCEQASAAADQQLQLQQHSVNHLLSTLASPQPPQQHQRQEELLQHQVQSSHTEAASTVNAFATPTVFIECVQKEAPRTDSTACSWASVVEQSETGSYVTASGVESAATAALCQQKQPSTTTGAVSAMSIASKRPEAPEVVLAAVGAAAAAGQSDEVMTHQTVSPASAAAPASVEARQRPSAGGSAAPDCSSCIAASALELNAAAVGRRESRHKVEGEADPTVGSIAPEARFPEPPRDDTIGNQPHEISTQRANHTELVSQLTPRIGHYDLSTGVVESSDSSSNRSSVTPTDVPDLPDKATTTAVKQQK